MPNPSVPERLEREEASSAALDAARDRTHSLRLEAARRSGGKIPTESLRDAERNSAERREKAQQGAWSRLKEAAGKAEDFVYENRKVIAAAGALLTLWGMMRRNSSARNWGLGILGVAGIATLRHRNEPRSSGGQNPTEQPGRSVTEGGSSGSSSEPSAPERGPNSYERARAEMDRTVETTEQTLTQARERFREIQSGARAWTEADIPLFAQAIEALRQRKENASPQVRAECDREIALYLPYGTNPNNSEQLLQSLTQWAPPAMIVLTGTMTTGALVGLMRRLRDRNAARMLIQAAQAGQIQQVDNILQNVLRLQDWPQKRLCEELVQLAHSGERGSERFREVLRLLRESGVNSLRQAQEICRSFSARSGILRLVTGLPEARFFSRGQILERLMSPAVRSVIGQSDEMAQGLARLLGSFGSNRQTSMVASELGEGASLANRLGNFFRQRGVATGLGLEVSGSEVRKLFNFLDYVNNLGQGEEVLRTLTQNFDRIQPLVRMHGPEILEALARNTLHPRFGELLTVLRQVKSPITLRVTTMTSALARTRGPLMRGAAALSRVGERLLPGQSWDVMMKRFLGMLDAGETAAEVGEKAGDILSRHQRVLQAFHGLGFALESVVALFHLYSMTEIDAMMENIQKINNEERLSVLRERLYAKAVMGGVGLLMGFVFVIKNPGLAPMALAMAIQYFVESGYESSSMARERRTRSAESWAVERRRENLIRSLVSEHGLSDGDIVNDWVLSGVTRENLTRGNIETRRRMLYGILLQDFGVSDREVGHQLMTEILSNKPVAELPAMAQMVKHAYAFIESRKPDVDPESPMEANQLISQARIYAQMRTQRDRLTRINTGLSNLRIGVTSALDHEFQTYLVQLQFNGEVSSLTPSGEIRTRLVNRFAGEKYPDVTQETLTSYENLRPTSMRGMERLINRNRVTPHVFFTRDCVPVQNMAYRGLETLYPLSGSVFDERSTETIPALAIRQNLEARINNMYTLLALESSSGGHRLAHHAEIDQCFNFCMRYYQAVMGVPYQPMSNTVQLEEGRVYRWIQSLALTRTTGHGFTTAPSAAEAQGYAMTDTEIEVNFQVSQQPTTMMLYAFARALGYRGPLRIEDIRQHFSEAKKEDLGFYYNGREWVVNDANGFDQEFEEWVDEKLADASIPASQRAFLQRVKSGELKAWEENPMVIDFLIDFCTRYKSEMFEREDERWWIPDDAEAAQAQERIGASYSTYLRAERDRIRGLEGPAARTAFQTQLNTFLGTHRGQYVVLPPAMIRTAYLAGFNNIGLFAYKLDGESIRAHQLSPLPNNERPSFITSIDNAASFEGFQFPDSLQRAIDALADERSAHANVLTRSKTALETQINSVEGLDTEKKESLRHATSGIVDDFGELDRIVFHETFEITDAHKRSFAQRMRTYILQVSQLVFRVRGNQSTEIMNEIYTIRRIVHKMKQLYLISFLNRSHVDEDSWIFHDHEVDQLSDFTRIEADMNAHMNQYAIGELYANNDGVRRFYTAEETRLENLIASVADGPNKNAYRQYYLRETSEIIYLANVYGFDSEGNLNREPPTIKPVIDTTQEREAMQRLLTSRRLNYQDWLRYYRGESAERAREQSQFNVQNHRRSVEPIVTREDQAFERAKLNATAATHAAKSMLAMCLTFRDLIGQIRQTAGQSATSRTDFGEINAVYNTFNGSRFMDGGLDSMGDVDLFSGRYREMDRAVDHPLFGTMFVNRSHEMVAFYRLHRTQMRQGVQMLWDYLAIDPELRSTFHRQLGDTRLDSFSIRRVTMLVQTLRQSRDILPAEQSNAFKLWYLANNPTLDQAVTYIEHHPDRNRAFFNAGSYERAAFETMYAELFHADAPIRALVGDTVAGQETLNKYVEARTAIRNIIRTIREAARDRDEYVMHRQLMAAVNKVRDFQRQYRTLLGEIGINADRWGWTSSRTLRLTRDLSLPAVNATNQRELLSGYTQPASEETSEADHFGEALEETFEERVDDVRGAVTTTNDAIVEQLDEWSEGAYSERVNQVRSSVSDTLSNAREEAKEIPLIGRLFE